MAYDKLCKPQVEEGGKFIRELNLSKGDRVLDMGCGTGILTKYIADIVGPDGVAVGVDPDAARIEIAVEKYEKSRNLRFHIGDSDAGFPHDDEPYYDAHVSTSVFHWIPNDQKKIYIQKAYKCLKSGGKLAIWCGEKMMVNDVEEDIRDFYPLTQAGYRDLFQAVDLFCNIAIDKIVASFGFQSFAEFKQWYKASFHQPLEDLDSSYFEKFITTENSGRVSWKLPINIITAWKD